MLVHGPRFRKLAKLVRRCANANSSTRCWRCGLTLAEAREKWGPRITWTAGHLVDGQPDHTLTLRDLAAEHSRCNYSAGASLANSKRVEPVSAVWR
jgi:hypothetical protein